MDIEKQLQHAVDRDEMHRLIEGLHDDQTAILITQCDTEDPDALDGQTVTYHHIGTVALWKALGLIECAKSQIHETHYHEDCCTAEEEE